MKDANETMNEQFKQFADFQAKSFQPLMPFASLAADATAKILQKNYEVMGDWVDYTVEQSQLPLRGDSPSDLAAAQMASTKKLSETLTSRATDYVEMAKGFGEKMQESAETVVKKTTNKAAAKAA